MSAAYDRAHVLIKALSALGTRASADVYAVNPPCVLVMPPDRRYDLSCGYTARWTFLALAPGALGQDRSTWLALDAMADAVEQVTDVTDVQLVAYTLQGKTYATYMITAEEAV